MKRNRSKEKSSTSSMWFASNRCHPLFSMLCNAKKSVTQFRTVCNYHCRKYKI